MSKKIIDSMMAGLLEAVAYARGEPLHGCKVHVPEAEQDQHSPPKRKGGGSNPSGNAN